MAKEENIFKESKWISRFAWSFVLIGFLFLIDGFATLKSPATLDQLGNLGSYYQGTVASFWALAGLLFIYETLRAQKEQLRTQQKQIADEEKSQTRRDFEASFFQLLNFQNQIAEQMRDTRQYQDVTVGRMCFALWSRDFRGRFGEGDDANLQKVLFHYAFIYKEHGQNLEHYFRTVYHVFKFCNESKVPQDELRRYTSLARAQLSAPELFLLFYNGLTPMGEKFKPLIEKFGLLEHLDSASLIHASHKNLYEESAYH